MYINKNRKEMIWDESNFTTISGRYIKRHLTR